MGRFVPIIAALPLPPLLLLLLSSPVSLISASRHKHSHRVPIINLNGAEELIGTIREDERVVNVSPHLHILHGSGPVCRFELSEEDGVQLFESEVLSKIEGTAEIRLRVGETVDCSDNEIHVKIVAVRCGDESAKSEPVTLKVRVQDVNNHEPEFDAPWYSFDFEEGRLGEIARLYATDKDCGHPYGKICRYEITNVNPHFKLDDQGVLSAVRPLNRSETDSHILTVVAHDCGMLKSKSALVTVHVTPTCHDGIEVGSASKLLVYAPSSGSDAGKRLMPGAKVTLCKRENFCTVKSAETKLQLAQTRRRIGPAGAKQCGLNKSSLDLLPRMGGGVVGLKERTEEAEGQEYLFDAEKSNSVIVPPSVVKSVVSQRFTLSFAMKHEAGSKKQQAVKQNLLCESDDFGMNRHHFAVYLRHCKLELLLRREAENSVSEFRAAEWRWNVDEVCDGEWHSYAILFADLDNVTLLVDGKSFEGTERNPEILDDWPLHQTRVHETRLVVGACWHGRNEKMVQFFNGKLASMYLLPDEVEPESVMQCLHKDPQVLQFDPVNQLVPGESAVFNRDGSELTLRAGNLDNLEALLQKVEYVASAPPKGYMPAGDSVVSVETRVECSEGNKSIPLGRREITVRVQKPVPTAERHTKSVHLFLSGRSLISTDRRSLKVGSVMLPDLQITLTETQGGGREVDATAAHKLDWCKVHLKPARDMDLEYFSSPSSLIASLNLDFEHDKQGIMLKGAEGTKGYTDVLQRIHYFNTRAEAYNKREYSIQCAAEGGKVLSNQFTVTMAITGDDEVEEGEKSIPPKDSAAVSSSSDDDALEPHYEPPYEQFGGANRLQNILDMDLPRPKALLAHHGFDSAAGQGSIAGGAVAIVVVACVGFLLVLLVVGVLKMRDGNPLPRRRRVRRMTVDGMEWDDNDGTNVNITINPLEEMDKAAGQNELSRQHSLYSDEDEEEEGEVVRGSSEDGESVRDDEEELTDDDEEEDSEAPVLPHAENAREGLEWDDSTLGPSSGTSGGKGIHTVNKKTYHV